MCHILMYIFQYLYGIHNYTFRNRKKTRNEKLECSIFSLVFFLMQMQQGCCQKTYSQPARGPDRIAPVTAPLPRWSKLWFTD